MDFYRIAVERDMRSVKNLRFKIYPVFTFSNSKDLIIKGGDMYAYWYNNQWHQTIAGLVSIIDTDIRTEVDKVKSIHPEAEISAKYMNDHVSNVMKEFAQYTKLGQQSDAQFNTRIIFSNEDPVREDYSTNKLAYTPEEGPTPAFDELFSKLYSEPELEKILWFIGALLTNKMEHIQKFMYLYGAKGTGKGTVINLIEALFNGYYQHISLARLTSGSEFATSQVKEVPLLIDPDSKINKIKDDTNLLKLTSHEVLTVNIKHKQMYDISFKGLLVTASNQRYQVNNIDSGITRRAVVVHPTNKTHDSATYRRLTTLLNFELPHIAQKAIDVFTNKGEYYYEHYVDVEMAEATDHIFAFVKEYHKQLGDPVTLKKASELYKIYLEDIGFEIRGFKRKIKEELKRYYKTFDDGYIRIGEELVSNVYRGFKYNLVFPNAELDKEVFDTELNTLEEELGLKHQPSIFDKVAGKYPAQYTNDRGNPMYKWDNVKTTLDELDTKKLHFVRVPENHIVIDLDLKENGEKSLVLNLNKAKEFPPTYMEISKSGAGVHLHYYYDGDVTILQKLYAEDIEVKVFSGKSALRRQLTKCNSVEIAHISTGLPEKEREKIKMYKEFDIIVWNENRMRRAIENNIRKMYHANTKPSMDFIYHIFEEAQKQGLKYDLRDMQQEIIIFAASSTNQKAYCLELESKIKYTTFDEEIVPTLQGDNTIIPKEELYFYDVEVFSNLFMVVYKKYRGEKVRLINPTSEEIENLLKKPLIGFNNRRYDNHILYGALLGYSNMELYRQSQKIINKDGDKGAFFGGAYELSYLDLYECSSKKQSLKKWEVELGIHHDELDIPWDKPVPEELWDRVGDYCGNDVDATEAVFDAIESDYNARLIISKLSGLSVNSKTQNHAEAFITEGKNDLQKHLVYTDLSTIFPGYKFEYGKSTYKGEDPSEGGRVFAKPGVYSNVGLFDIKSMHPNSLILLNYFGKYTQRFADLVDARIAVKEKRFEDSAKYFNGALAEFLSEDTAGDLAYALKIIINIVYGMSSAPYANPFKTMENVDNIVAKRGALFMIELQLHMEQLGYDVVHIKTDSIKIPNFTDATVKEIMDFGKKYGYEFDFESIYGTFALVNKSIYIAKDIINPKTNEIVKEWDAVGATFANPVVMKKLFTNEELKDEDFALVKEVKNAAIHIGDKFVGRLAEVYASVSGQDVWRVVDGEKKGHVTGTKNHGWRLFSEFKGRDDIDMLYYNKVIKSAYEDIEKVGDPKLLTEYTPV